MRWRLLAGCAEVRLALRLARRIAAGSAATWLGVRAGFGLGFGVGAGLELGVRRGWWLRRHLLEYHHPRRLDDLAGVLLERDQLAQREGIPRHAEGGEGQLRRMVHLPHAELQARSLRVAGGIT